jgi:hypothetical protein
MLMLVLTSCSESVPQGEKQSLATAELVDPASIYCEFRDHVWDYNWGCFRVIGINYLVSESEYSGSPLACWNMAILMETTPFWFDQGIPDETMTWSESGAPEFIQCVTYSESGAYDMQGFDVGETDASIVTTIAARRVCEAAYRQPDFSYYLPPCENL